MKHSQAFDENERKRTKEYECRYMLKICNKCKTPMNH